MKKVLNPGRGAADVGEVFIKVEYDGKRLSIVGVEGPKRNGDCRGGCGQIVDFELNVFAEGWDAEKVEALRSIWKRYHLNDMRAGSPAQMAFLESNPVDYKYPKSYYEEACKALADAGLHPDPSNGYKYGSAWLFEEVPADVIAQLESFPDSALVPAWV